MGIMKQSVKTARSSRAKSATTKTKKPATQVVKKSSAKKPKRLTTKIWDGVKNFFKKLHQRNRDFRSRRPHRSFRPTRRRDTVRKLKLPGYIAFGNQVWQMILKNRGLFLKFFLLYAVLSALIVGMLSQENYGLMRDTINSMDNDPGISKWISLFSGAVTGNVGSGTNVDSGQQILSVLFLLVGWLTIVWLLRHVMAGHKVKLRDGLYQSGAPLIATFMIVLVMVVQLLPFAIAMLIYAQLTGVGIINTGIAIENMAAWCALAVIAAMTLYWLTSSFIALIMVTLPGMYPFRALKAAGDMVVGRRLKILYRLLWMALPMLILWIVVLVPAILADDKWQIEWLPLVPIAALLLTTITLIWVATYIYMLYRKVVENDTESSK